MPDVKAAAAELCARWGMSLSDAVNAFLVKSIDVGACPSTCVRVTILQPRFPWTPALVPACCLQRWTTRRVDCMTILSKACPGDVWLAYVWLAYVRFADHLSDILAGA